MFDLEADDEPEPEPTPRPAPPSEDGDLGSGSLFDLGPDEDDEIPEGGSLFDLAAPEADDSEPPEPEPEDGTPGGTRGEGAAEGLRGAGARAPDGRRHQRGRLAVRPLKPALTCDDVTMTPFDVN